jgi:hypothetical protein
MKKIVVLIVFFMFIAACGGTSTTNIYIYPRNLGDSNVIKDSNSSVNSVYISDTAVILGDDEEVNTDK